MKNFKPVWIWMVALIGLALPLISCSPQIR
jgi:hypothetical protein